MRNKLITEIIFKKMGFSQELLIENRLPSLYAKYSGTKVVPLESIPAHKIMLGERPKTHTISKLDSRHDVHAASGFGSVPALSRKLEGDKETAEDWNNRRSKHMVDKIAEADPTQSKEYTDRMLQWYSNSSNHPKSTGTTQTGYGSTHPDDKGVGSAHHNMTSALSSGRLPGWENPATREAYVQKGLQIHTQLGQAKQKEEEEKHSSHPDFRFKSEDLGRAKDALEIFHRIKHTLPPEHRDINKINSLHHLEDIVEPHRFRVSGGEAERRIKEEGTTLLHDDPELSVYHVKTPEASCALGAGTRWCVSGHHNNMFDDYNESSPMILFHDKTGKLSNTRSSGNRRMTSTTNRRFMFHFGSNRHATNVQTDEEPDIDDNNHGVHTDHQLMDERDHPYNYHEFVGAFPQAKKIPALQHLHATLFQDKTLSERKEEAKTPEGFNKILKHIEKYPEMQRGSDPKIKYLTSLLETKPIKNQHTSIRSEQIHEITSSHDHPIMMHLMEHANDSDRNEFTSHLKNNNIKLPSKSIIHLMNRNINHETIKNLVSFSDEPEVHRVAYHKLREMNVPFHSSPTDGRHTAYEAYDFLGHTTDPNLLAKAHMDLKNLATKKDSTGGKYIQYTENDNPRYYPNTDAHENIARNPHTPTHVLEDIIKNKPLHGFHEKDSEEEISTHTGRYPLFVNPRSKDNAGLIAMNNLLMREDNAKARRK